MTRRTLLGGLAPAILVGQSGPSSNETSLRKALASVRPELVQAVNGISGAAIKSLHRGQRRAADFEAAAGALRILSLELERAGVYQASEPYFKDNLERLRGIRLEETFSRHLNEIQTSLGISIEPSKRSRMIEFAARNHQTALEVMMKHDMPERRAIGTATAYLKARAKYYASAKDRGNPSFIPVMQGTVNDVPQEDPVFSVTACGNCNDVVVATVGLVGVTWALGGFLCPVCAVGGGGLAFIWGVIAFELSW